MKKESKKEEKRDFGKEMKKESSEKKVGAFDMILKKAKRN
jgi:hypothetical protein